MATFKTPFLGYADPSPGPLYTYLPRLISWPHAWRADLTVQLDIPILTTPSPPVYVEGENGGGGWEKRTFGPHSNSQKTCWRVHVDVNTAILPDVLAQDRPAATASVMRTVARVVRQFYI